MQQIRKIQKNTNRKKWKVSAIHYGGSHGEESASNVGDLGLIPE